MNPMECVVCNKLIKTGLYNEDSSAFCNTVCATWFARAVINTMFIPGDDWRRIDSWLSQFTMITKKRKGRE